MNDRASYPVRIEGELRAEPSRWLWLVKWLLAIPHYIVLAFLWLAYVVLTVVAFFAILFTARYPRGLFEFNVGFLRWAWRVAFYSYGALGTDRYPPFTLDDVPDYPARLHIDYPERLSRGRVLVKWWLLAIPHYMVVGILVGGGTFAARSAGGWWWMGGFPAGLIDILVLVAGVALLFTARYPRGLFDFVLGLDRWVARVVVYAGLMTDRYPPFRLDQGGSEPPLEETEGEPMPAPEPATEPKPAHVGAGRVVLVVLGSIAAILAFGFLAAGSALVVIDRTQRDEDGYLMSPGVDLSTATYAIVSESANIDSGGAQWALDTFLGDVRVRSESQRIAFVGIGPASDVDNYLLGVEHVVVTDIEGNLVFGGDTPRPKYSERAGGPPRTTPAGQAFWVASATGSGEQTVDWDPTDGEWRLVVMNEDASRGVASHMSVGAKLDSVLWIGIVLFTTGVLLAAGAAFAINSGARRR
ncbi:MAG: DUF4389 domain-containing protein [Chloroflexi bacterium]|nr:DUF4389 domain-containing protein [Chloroflexota bacterium]